MTSPLERLALPTGALTPKIIAQDIAHLLPEHAIVMNESATAGTPIPGFTSGAAAHDWLDLMGGAIGQGMPAATGAAVACPDRKVLCLQADGSGMYTLQALWTQAREELDVTTVIFSNRRYAILEMECSRVGAGEPPAATRSHLSRPDLDWVGRGLERGFSEAGPYLVEAVL